MLNLQMRWLLFVLIATLAFGQERRSEREFRGRDGERGGPPMRFNPIFAALDADGDGVISAAELANASVALKKLDKNGDGQLTAGEVRPNFEGRGPGGPSGPSPDEMVSRMMEFDKDGDGKLSKAEVPERMQGIFARGDSDGDGLLTKDELRKLAATQANRPERGPRER